MPQTKVKGMEGLIERNGTLYRHPNPWEPWLNERRSKRLSGAMGVKCLDNTEQAQDEPDIGPGSPLERKTHVDSRRFIGWIRREIERREENLADVLGDLDRLRRRWEVEPAIPVRYVETPDRIMVRLGLVEPDIPDECWAMPPSCVECGTPMWDAPRTRRFCTKVCNRRARKRAKADRPGG